MNDNNVLYDVQHFYSPFEYTHQGSPQGFPTERLPDGGKYPDTNLTIFPSDLEWVANIPASANNRVPQIDTDWTFYESELFQVSDPQIIVAVPTFTSFDNSGAVAFDGFTVDEFDTDGQFVRNIVTHDVSSQQGWFSYSEDGTGDFALESQGRDDSAALSIATHTDQSTWSNPDLGFEVQQGMQYKISGWMKGDNVGAQADVYLTLDFLSSPSGAQVMRRDKDFLAFELDRGQAFSRDNNVPAMVGEFGLYERVMFDDDKGGVQWLTDVVDLLMERQASFCLWAYRGDFGVYLQDSEQPFDPASLHQGTRDVFVNALAGD